jgi:hypothetical protein
MAAQSRPRPGCHGGRPDCWISPSSSIAAALWRVGAMSSRVVIVPGVIVSVLQLHLRWLAQPGEDGLLFTSPEGKPLRYDNFRNRIWYPALRDAGLPRPTSTI